MHAVDDQVGGPDVEDLQREVVGASDAAGAEVEAVLQVDRDHRALRRRELEHAPAIGPGPQHPGVAGQDEVRDGCAREVQVVENRPAKPAVDRAEHAEIGADVDGRRGVRPVQLEGSVRDVDGR